MRTANNVLKRFPKLYGKTKNGSIKTWEIWVESLFGEVCIKMSHGLKDGKKTMSSKVVKEGKNIGKANETTPTKQAIKEAKARWTKQCDKGYVEDESNVDNIFSYFPMLAKTYYHPKSPDVVKGKKKITTLPKLVILQPKLNGVRCVAVKKNNVVKLYSRNGKEYTPYLTTLVNYMSKVMGNGMIWDGELYVHGWSFKRIIECVKRDKSLVWRKKIKYHCKKREWDLARWWMLTRNDNNLIEFHRYDYPSCDLNADMRLDEMMYCWGQGRIVQVETLFDIGDHNKIKTMHDKWVRQGYEGVIIRDIDAKYIWNARDKRLLKYKEFIDEEFEIVGYKQGTGTDSGAIIFICKVGKGKGSGILFDARPRGEISVRRSMYKRRRSYIGKMLTVRFQEWTDKGVPLFPVGLEVRDYE